MNCSGKHAAMLATCVANGWSIDDYLDPRHPLQLAITARVCELAGPVDHIGVDGCGSPAHAVGLDALARAFGELARRQGPVWSAMTNHPELVGGERRDVTRLMRAVPGLMAKDGAEGVFAAALPDGRAAAVKISDGASRAAGVVVAAALAAAGVDVDPSQFGEPIRGHGEPVGSVSPAFGGRCVTSPVFRTLDDVEYGRVDQVSPLIRRVIAENPSKFTYRGTGTYIVGRGDVVVIDPGPRLDSHREALAGGAARRARAGDPDHPLPRRPLAARGLAARRDRALRRSGSDRTRRPIRHGRSWRPPTAGSRVG